jgi:ankyrin repeat/SOCS box protein 17
MNANLECYFDDVFSQMEQSLLMVRYRRRRFVDYLNTVITDRVRCEEWDEATAVRCAVTAAIRYHASSRSSGGRLCLVTGHHNILYIAAKLCFVWNLDDNSTVIELLNNIYQCERTFERLFVGAIFGIGATHIISGWKSDFENHEENLAAIEYFLKHATKAKLEYDNINNGKKTRFIDIPMESYGQAKPVHTAVEFLKAEVLLLLLRYGADIMTVNESDKVVMGQAPRQPFSFCFSSSQLSQSGKLLVCLKILLRSIRTVRALCPSSTDMTVSWIATENVLGANRFYLSPRLLKEGKIPPSRSQLKPPELKHLSRCVIRHVLRENWQLPLGIRSLQIPLSLQNYLDLLED